MNLICFPHASVHTSPISSSKSSYDMVSKSISHQETFSRLLLHEGNYIPDYRKMHLLVDASIRVCKYASKAKY